jgi:glycosyltransferase involved in cell wall biosynthesis
MLVPLVLVGNQTKTHQETEWEQLDDFAPRQDYIEIARILGGTLVGSDWCDATWYSWVQRVERRVRLNFVEAIYAVSQLHPHNVVFSTSEKVAIPLAALLSITKRKIPHIVMAHKLSSGLKTHLFQIWHFYNTFDHIISDCRFQVDYAINQLGVPEAKVDFIYHHVDHHFYRPPEIDSEDYILAVGQEQRDYGTLLQAIAGTEIRLVIVASSPWSTSRIEMDKIGETTVLSHIPYRELRALYAKARLVVTPLLDVDYAAGNTSLLEAMAMAKPVIVSRTRGITDYIVHNETGMYVSPGDPAELRDTILSLWDNPGERDRLGTNGRQAIEEQMNLDIYVNKIADIMASALSRLN